MLGKSYIASVALFCFSAMAAAAHLDVLPNLGTFTVGMVSDSFGIRPGPGSPKPRARKEGVAMPPPPENKPPMLDFLLGRTTIPLPPAAVRRLPSPCCVPLPKLTPGAVRNLEDACFLEPKLTGHLTMGTSFRAAAVLSYDRSARPNKVLFGFLGPPRKVERKGPVTPSPL